MNKLISIALLFLMPVFCFALDEQIRTDRLEEGSQFLINFNNSELFDKGEIEWKTGDDDTVIQECHLAIKSHYDEKLARSIGSAVYTFKQFHPGSSYIFRSNESREQITLWMTTENKNLPLLVLDCFWATRGPAAPLPPMTLKSIAEFIQQPGFFKRPVISPVEQRNATEIRPPYDIAIVEQDLYFSAVRSENSSVVSVVTPRIKDGNVVTSDSVRGACSASYSSRPTDDKSYEITVRKGTLLRVKYVNVGRLGTYIFYFESPSPAFEISVHCFFQDLDKPTWADFAKHLNGVITVK